MKFVSVHLKSGEFGNRLDIKKIVDADSQADAYKKFASDFGNRNMVLWMQVPEGLDPRTVKAVEESPGVIELQTDPSKVQAAMIEDAKILILEKYDQMNTDVLAQMQVVFKTTQTESATAYYETWKRMSSNPALFASAGLTSDRKLMAANNKTVLFEENDALDTIEKVKSFADRCLVLADEYAVWRMVRIKQFRDERTAILEG